MNTETKVKEIICDLLGVEEAEVTPTTNLKEELQMDSIDFADIVMQIEDEFDIEADEEKMASIVTLEDIVKYIDSEK